MVNVKVKKINKERKIYILTNLFLLLLECKS